MRSPLAFLALLVTLAACSSDPPRCGEDGTSCADAGAPLDRPGVDVVQMVDLGVDAGVDLGAALVDDPPASRDLPELVDVADAGPVRLDGCGLDPDGACVVPGDVPPDMGVPDAGAPEDRPDAMVCDTGPCTCPDGRSGNYTCLSEWCVCTGPLDAGADVEGVDRPDAMDVPRDALPDACASTTVGNCCGVACGALPNATGSVCLGGRCGYGACAEGYDDCDRDPANGCEVNLRSSASNCGACGAPCAAGRVCQAAACVACPSGQVVCDGRCVVLSSNVSNCGACGNACPGASNAFAGCAGGSCLLSCAAGFADCDDSTANGCETSTRTDRLNCGSCGRVCPALQTCRDSACVIL